METTKTQAAAGVQRCAVCKKGEAKYRCPRCLIRSCSLPCVKRHKEDVNCNGVREKTNFVKISGFEDLNLLSDYRFLEDVNRKAENASRDPIKYVGMSIPYRLKKMVNGARQKGTTLRLLPKSFTKRVMNGTKFLYATKQMSWMVEWVFPHVEAKHYDTHLEKETIAQALLKVYNPKETDSIVRHTLRGYIPKGVDGVRFFMRKEECPANDVRFYELKPSDALSEALRRKVVIEFPTIHVVFNEKADQYPLVEGTNETESESESDDNVEDEKDKGRAESPGDKRSSSSQEDSEVPPKKCKAEDDKDHFENESDISTKACVNLEGSEKDTLTVELESEPDDNVGDKKDKVRAESPGDKRSSSSQEDSEVPPKKCKAEDDKDHFENESDISTKACVNLEGSEKDTLTVTMVEETAGVSSNLEPIDNSEKECPSIVEKITDDTSNVDSLAHCEKDSSLGEETTCETSNGEPLIESKNVCSNLTEDASSETSKVESNMQSEKDSSSKSNDMICDTNNVASVVEET